MVYSKFFILSTTPYANGDLFCFESVPSLLLPWNMATSAVYLLLALMNTLLILRLLRTNPAALSTSHPLHLFFLLLTLTSLGLSGSEVILLAACSSDNWLEKYEKAT